MWRPTTAGPRRREGGGGRRRRGGRAAGGGLGRPALAAPGGVGRAPAGPDARRRCGRLRPPARPPLLALRPGRRSVPSWRGAGAGRRRGARRGGAAVAALGAEWIAVPALVPDEWAAAHAFLRAIGAAPDALSQWEM